MSTTSFQAGEHFAREMDARDPLAHLRQRFFLPTNQAGEEVVYLCGHSLGLQPKTTRAYIEQELQDWARLGVEGHFHAKHPWIPYHRLLAEQTAELVGAQPSEVVVMNTLTVNLHLMMVSFYRPTSGRHKILVEKGAFPSDQYAVQSQIRFHGFDPGSSLLELSPREGESHLRDEDILEFIETHGDSIALVLVGGVNYVTGQYFNLPEITKAGQRKGCIVGFDLAHAAGNLPLRLHDWGPDFCVWCSYKYLNGGPGCVGGCFVHERHAREGALPRFAGWWGHDEKSRFQMGPEFRCMPGAEGWQLSNPPILSLAPLRAATEIFAEVGMQRLREKSMLLTGYLDFLLRASSSPKLCIITPADPAGRGAQLSLRLRGETRAVCDRLAAHNVLGDWREPDVLRIAPVPLYNTFQDVYRFSEIFKQVLW